MQMAKRKHKPAAYGVVTRHARETVEEVLQLGKRLNGSLDDVSELRERLIDLRKEAIPALAEALLRDDIHERFLAAWFILIYDIEAPKSVPTPVARDAAIAISSALETANDDLKLTLCMLLGAGGVVPKESRGELKKLLNHPAEAIQYHAAGAVVRLEPIDPEAVQVLGSALKGANAVCAAMAAVTLLRIKVRTTDSIEALSSRLHALPAELQYHLLNSVKPLGAQAAALRPALASLLKDKDAHPLLRSNAAATLGRVCEGTTDGVSDLLAAIKQDEWEIVLGAAEGLAAGDEVPEEAIQRLTGLLSHQDVNYRRAAAHGLSYFGKRAASAIPALLDHVGKECESVVCEDLVCTFSNIGEAAIRPMVQTLRDGDVRKLPVISAALLMIGADAVPAVLPLLQESNANSRKLALVLMRSLGSCAAAAVDQLGEILDAASDEEETGYALAVCRELGPKAKEVAPAIVRCLLKEDGPIVEMCLVALGRIGPDVRPLLEAAIQNEEGGRRQRLERALNGLRASDDRRFARFEALDNDKLLRMFAEIGRLLVKQTGPMTWPQISETLTGQAEGEEHYGGFPTSPSSLRKGMDKLKEQLGVKLTAHGGNKPGSLTPEGQSLLPDVLAYLSAKRRRGAVDE